MCLAFLFSCDFPYYHVFRSDLATLIFASDYNVTYLVALWINSLDFLPTSLRTTRPAELSYVDGGQGCFIFYSASTLAVETLWA